MRCMRSPPALNAKTCGAEDRARLALEHAETEVLAPDRVPSSPKFASLRRTSEKRRTPTDGTRYSRCELAAHIASDSGETALMRSENQAVQLAQKKQ